jgi:RNA polymerase sigma-70 factor (ECF subfamily)
MATSIQQARLASFTNYFPLATRSELLKLEEAYERNRHRIYSLAFWMTDNEMTAEDLMLNVFLRVFAHYQEPTDEVVDRALITELREQGPLGLLTLECAGSTEIVSVRSNLLRVHLERAVVQIPRTERLAFLLHDVEGYGHNRIGKLLGLTESESQIAVHQARLRIRELVSQMD